MQDNMEEKNEPKKSSDCKARTFKKGINIIRT